MSRSIVLNARIRKVGESREARRPIRPIRIPTCGPSIDPGEADSILQEEAAVYHWLLGTSAVLIFRAITNPGMSFILECALVFLTVLVRFRKLL